MESSDLASLEFLKTIITKIIKPVNRIAPSTADN